MGKRILIVDDETDFLDIISQRIESWGYGTILASNAKEAMDALMSEKPDVIILDYIMPDINGIELLNKIRDIDTRVPVIMFTAKPDMDAIGNSERLDILAFIPKLSAFADTQASLKTTLDMAFKRKGGNDGK